MPIENNILPTEPIEVTREVYATGVQMRESSDEKESRVITGCAIRFNEPAVVYEDSTVKIREVIAPEAVTMPLLDSSDIKLTMFHNRELILGRSNKGKGTLKYEVREDGVYFTCDVARTIDGDKAIELVKRGDIAGCSFRFTYNPREKAAITSVQGGGEETYTIHKIREIRDFTLAADPVYKKTSVSVEKVREMYNQSTEEPMPTEQQMRELEQGQRANEIVAEAQEEQRELTPAETAEVTAAVVEEPVIENRENINPNFQPTTTTMPTFEEQMREAIKSGRRTEIEIVREDGTYTPITSTVADGAGMVAINPQEVVKALNAGVIYGQLGIPMRLSQAGTYVWPVAGTAETKIVGENVAIAPKNVDLSKIVAKPERMACSTEVTYETITQTENAIQSVVLSAMYESADKAINNVLLSPTKVAGAAAIQGPFVEAAKTGKVVTLPATLTFKAINGLKAKLLTNGVDLAKCAFVVSPARYCELEGTPKDAGSGIMMLENGKLCGLPVFASDAITDGYIGLGDFSNQPAGIQGGMRLIVDPYTAADRNAVKFTLNFGFATATIRPEAFVCGKFTA